MSVETAYQYLFLMSAFLWVLYLLYAYRCALQGMGEDYRMLILADHKTLTATRGHDGDPVPYILYDSRATTGSGLSYTEANAETGPLMEAGTGLMAALFEV